MLRKAFNGLQLTSIQIEALKQFAKAQERCDEYERLAQPHSDCAISKIHFSRSANNDY
jgi:hypothetical protein